MGRVKSFVKNISIDTAKRSHSCKHDKKHLIKSGDKRLKFKIDRADQYFCVECAKESIEKDIEKLNKILSELNKIGFEE